MKGVGLCQNYPHILVFCINSVPYFTKGLEDAQALCKVGATCVRWGAKMDSIQNTLNQSGAIPTLGKWHVESNYCNWWNLDTCVWTGNKRQSNEWNRHGSPRRHEFRQNQSYTKVRIILAYDSQGILENHPVREGRVPQIISAVQLASYTAGETSSTSKHRNKHPW